MGLPPLSKIPLILRPQAWLHRRHYGEVLSPIRWWGRIPFIFYLNELLKCWLVNVVVCSTTSSRSTSTATVPSSHKKSWVSESNWSSRPQRKERLEFRAALFVSLPAAGLGEGMYGTRSQPPLTKATSPLNRHSAPFHSHSRPSYNCRCKESA